MSGTGNKNQLVPYGGSASPAPRPSSSSRFGETTADVLRILECMSSPTLVFTYTTTSSGPPPPARSAAPQLTGPKRKRQTTANGPHYYEACEVAVNDTTIIGSNNIIVGEGNHVQGDYNTVQGSYCRVFGHHNTVQGNHHDVVGNDNIVQGNYARTTGMRNVVQGNHTSITARNLKPGECSLSYEGDDPLEDIETVLPKKKAAAPALKTAIEEIDDIDTQGNVVAYKPPENLPRPAPIAKRPRMSITPPQPTRLPPRASQNVVLTKLDPPKNDAPVSATDVKKATTCSLCSEYRKRVMLNPCGHFTCVTCANKLVDLARAEQRCPICHVSVTEMKLGP